MSKPLTEILIRNICNNPQLLIDDLGLEIVTHRESISGRCPIHNSDNDNSFILYLNSGIFRCFTANCHEVFKNSCLGLVRGILSNRYCRWSKIGDPIYSWNKTINYLCDLYGVNKGKISFIKRDNDRENFINMCRPNEKKENRFIMTRDYYLRANTSISQYFIDRGFSREVLEKYDVFSCFTESKSFFKRSMVPVYEDNHKTLIGISARAECGQEPRWKYTVKFPSATTLYPLWSAQHSIKKQRSCIVVESPKSVWKLNMAGIDNCVSIWSALGWNDYKRYLLDNLGVMKLIVILDNDEAGLAGREKIRKEAGRFYNISDVTIPLEYNDIADMPVDQVKVLFNKV